MSGAVVPAMPSTRGSRARLAPPAVNEASQSRFRSNARVHPVRAWRRVLSLQRSRIRALRKAVYHSVPNPTARLAQRYKYARLTLLRASVRIVGLCHLYGIATQLRHGNAQTGNSAAGNRKADLSPNWVGSHRSEIDVFSVAGRKDSRRVHLQTREKEVSPIRQHCLHSTRR